MMTSHALVKQLEDEYKNISHQKVLDSQEEVHLIPTTIRLSPKITPTLYPTFNIESHLSMNQNLLLETIKFAEREMNQK